MIASRVLLAVLMGLLIAVQPALAGEPAKAAGPVRGPLSPAQALAAFHLEPGLRIELVAAEPQVLDPVAMAFDEDGRLWVAEMGDYPNGPAPGKPPAGRIRLLEDRDGDGRYEHSAVFADQLLFANGLLPWKSGLVVTDAPSILYLRDADGDGRAEVRERLFEGFTAGNPQLRVSHPNLGIDNWIYVANGLRGGKVVRSGRTNEKPIELGGMDFRFDLIHDRYETISGMGQFGLTFDDWGRRFVCDNHHHLRHVVLPNRYVQRNPYLAVPELVEDVSVLAEGEGGAGAKIYPLSKNWTTSSLHIGRFTAACGVFVYRGDLLLPAYRGAAFTCDPTGDLVHEEVLEPSGATFRSHPARQGVEFLASPDDWFRPVSMALGPEGALYVVDMYRAVIEHPEFMPTELKNRPDLNLGKDKGRIWRIVPETYHGPSKRPHLSAATTAELVSLLAHPSAWWRVTAQRLLLERQDPAAGKLVREAASSSPDPLARLHAAWLLESRGELVESLLLALLDHPNPRVREHAVRLSEPRLAASSALQGRLKALAGDSDARLRYQVALSLGEWDDDRIIEPLARIAVAGLDDRWTRFAVASSVPKRAAPLIVALLEPASGLRAASSPNRFTLLRELAALAGARRDPSEVRSVIETALAAEGSDAARFKLALANGLAEGMTRRGTQLGAFLKSLDRAPGQTEDKPPLLERMSGLFDQAAAVAKSAHQDPQERLDAVRLLAHAPWKTASEVLGRLLVAGPNQEMRVAAVRALAARNEPEAAEQLMDAWKDATPAVRRELTLAMLRSQERIGRLLDALEAQRIKPGDIDPVGTRQLLAQKQPALRDRARKLLKDAIPEARLKVIERYHAAIDLAGDPARGRTVFQKNCATCHEVAGVGVRVGPDIADTRTKTREALLGDILNPNQAIDGNYINYVVSTKDGAIHNGFIAAETSSSLTLRRAENQTDVLLRQDIEEIRSTGLSLMPDNLDQAISVPEMADLLTFLKDWRYLDGAVPRTSAK